MSRKKEELQPEMIENNDLSDKNLDILRNTAKELNKGIVNVGNKEEEEYYQTVVKNLFDTKDIELKTEYLNPSENFAGAKLAFLAKYADIPFMDEFITTLERKRVSLERKSRQEIIMAIQERRQAEEEARQRNMMNMFGMG